MAPPSENFKKKSKTGYFSNSSAPLRAARMSKEVENCKDLGLVELLLYFSVKIEWHSKNYLEIIIFKEFLLISNSFSEFT